MNFIEASKLAEQNNKRMKRQHWSNFMAPNIAYSMLKKDDIASTDWLVEDDILTISLTELKQKIKILKAQDQTALLAALGINVSNKDHA